MIKIGRNEPCPCGSGKKYKKCHMGREDDLVLDNIGEVTVEISSMITSLPAVSYGRSREIIGALDIKKLTESSVGIKCVDLKRYIDLNLFGSSHPKASKGDSGGIFINLYKTTKTDPDHIYLAISPNIDDSTLIHELAHVLDYLGGSELMPGTLEPLSYEIGIPVEHLEHPEEFGNWLNYLKTKFDVQLDADDAIINYLYENGMLIRGEDVHSHNTVVLKTKSDSMLKFLSENYEEIDAMIRNLSGYIGSRESKD
ncbi:MAG: SEC-C domain-containing protein [Desulfatiglans sp.]|jgi:hypothetical protein|nr:SEC-C domain-containing protein [Desulfatiglans sp.]